MPASGSSLFLVIKALIGSIAFDLAQWTARKPNVGHVGLGLYGAFPYQVSLSKPPLGSPVRGRVCGYSYRRY